MSTCEQSADDFFMSLNGFDELAIAKFFGGDVYELKEKPFIFLRSLVFVHQRRSGLKDREAHQAAMEMSIQGVDDYFPDAEPELDPDDPDTPEGKDD